VTLPLIERDESLALLAGLLARARGEGKLIVVEGPAGVGKTRLLHELKLLGGSSAGVDFLEARAAELERDYTLAVVLRLLEQRIAQASLDEEEALFRGQAGLARPVFGYGRPEEGPAINDEFVLVHSLYWLLVNLADAAPLALIIDDVQWADEQSMRFLLYLAQRIHDLPIAIVVAVRTGDVAADGETLSRLLLEADETVGLRELSREGTKEFLSAALEGRRGVHGIDDLAESVWAATRGNPFLLREVTSGIGGTSEATGPVVVPDGAPDSVARSVMLRIHALGPRAVALARAVSVLTTPTDIAAAAHVAALAAADAVFAGERLTSAHILSQDDGLAFHHPLIRSAVYARMGADERLTAHRRAAEFLHERGAADEEVALHLLRTPPFPGPWATQTLRAASRNAGRKGAPATAAGFLRRALEQSDLTTRDRAEILIELGVMEAAAGETESLAHLERALELLDEPGPRARGMYALGQTLFRYGRPAEALTVFRRGADDFADSDREIALRFEAGYLASAAYLVGRPRDAVERLDRLAENLSSPEALTPAERLILLHVSVYRSMSQPVAADHAALALRALGDGLLLWRETSDGMTLSHTVLGLTWAGSPAAAVEVADRVLEDARRRGDSLIFAEMSLARALAMYAQGFVREAMADAQSAVIGMSRGWSSTVPAPHGIQIYCHLDRGELTEALDVLRTAEQGLRDEQSSTLNVWFYMARGRVRMHQGQYDDAFGDFLHVGELLEGNGYTNPGYMLLPWRSQAAMAAHRIQRPQVAVDLVETDIREAERFRLPSTLGAALRTRALISSPPDLDLLRRAVEVLDVDGTSRLELAETLLELGSAQRRARDRIRCRDTLRRASDLAHRCGALVLERRAHDELLAAGARPRRAVIQGPDSLTPSEHRIATLMGDGFTSRQIAEDLYLSISTVEWHRRNIYRKLDVSSRESLRAAMSGRPLQVEG